MKIRMAALLALISLLPVAAVTAQEELDTTSGDTNYGGIALDANFEPDPYVFTLLSGGDVDARALDLGEGCQGNVTSTPDFVIEWDGDIALLRIFFLSEGDTTLIVYTPSGDYVCSDDGAGGDVNPVVDLPNPEAGEYYMWVGSFGANVFNPGYLLFTRGVSQPGAINQPLLSAGGTTTNTTSEPDPSPTPDGEPTAVVSEGGFNIDQPATFAELVLEADFQPDPAEVEVTAGGNVDASGEGLGGACRGFVAGAPDVSIEWSGDADTLRLFFASDGDTTLIVRTPGGEYRCNDDYPGGVDPLVDVDTPEDGLYTIWVGTFNSANTLSGTLYVTQDTALDPTSLGN